MVAACVLDLVNDSAPTCVGDGNLGSFHDWSVVALLTGPMMGPGVREDRVSEMSMV